MSGISLDYGLSPPETCRVELNPGVCNTSPFSQMVGNQTFTNDNGVTFRQYGMTRQNYNVGLRMPQMRTFLGPDYFNSGCTSLYCKDGAMCPQSVVAKECQLSSDMFDYLFTHQGHHTGNGAPPPCFGGKCSGYDSTLGWQTDTNAAVLNWQKSDTCSS